MLSIVQVFSLNAYISMGIGLPWNFALLWYIHRYTQPEMRAFSLILLQNCLTDIFTLLEQTLMIPMICAGDRGGAAAVLIGPLSSGWTYPWNVIVIFWIYSLFSLLGKHQFLIYFIYKWLLITKSYKMRIWMFTLALFTPILVINILDTMETDFVATAERRGLSPASAAPFGLRPEQIQNPIMRDNTSYTRIDETLRICLDLFSLLGVLFFAFKTSRFVRRNLHGPSAERDRDLHRQLTRTLILQMMLAFACSYLPSIVLKLVLMFPTISLSPALGLWLNPMLTALHFWIPALNPLVTMMIIKSYRLAFWKAMSKFYNYFIYVICCGANNSPVVTTITTPMNREPVNRELSVAAFFLRQQHPLAVSSSAFAMNNINHANINNNNNQNEGERNIQHQGNASSSATGGGNQAQISMVNFSANKNNNKNSGIKFAANHSRIHPADAPSTNEL